MTSDKQRNLSVCVLLAGLWFSCATEAVADNGPQPSLRLDVSQKYPASGPPGADTPDFYYTARGQLVMIRGNLDTVNYSLASDDQGRTWHKWEASSTWPEMTYLDVVRRGNELLAFGYDKQRTCVWWSSNEGVTWPGSSRITPQGKMTAILNQRILLTGNGRLIVPIDRLLGGEGPGPDQVGTMYSDDAGRSWKQSPLFGPPPPLPDRPEGFGEPAAVELADGRIWLVFRSLFGHLWQAWSTDGGATWGPPSATTLVSPLSAVNAKRIPGSDVVVVIWNNAKPDVIWNKKSIYSFGNNTIYTPRSPLAFAVSQDNCKTWSEPVVIDRGSAAYPSLCFSEKEMFVCYFADPNPKTVSWCNPNSRLTLVAYDIQSLLRFARKASK